MPLRPWSAKKALCKGLIDAAVDRSRLADEAVALASAGESSSCLREASKEPSVFVRWTSSMVLGSLGFVLKNTGLRKYPAPTGVLEVIDAAYKLPEEKAFELESCTFARLCKTDMSRRCVQKFLELQQAKKAKIAAH